jgi:hypothetical protein
MRRRSCVAIFCGLAITAAAAVPIPSQTPSDEEALLKEFASLDPATQKKALEWVRKKGGQNSKETTASDSAKPAGNPTAANSPPPRPVSFLPADPSKLPTFGKPGPATKAVEEPTVGSWLEHNIEIRNSFYDSKQADSPAKISWTKNIDQAAFYTIDAAVVGTFLQKHPSSFNLLDQAVFLAVSPLFEAHISSQANTSTKHNSQDSLLYALPVTFTYGRSLTPSEITDWMAGPTVNDPGSKYRSSDWIQGEIILNPAFRMDRENNVNAFEGGAYWKPGTWIPVGVNVRKRILKNFLTFRWEPIVGFEIGEYDNTSDLSPNIPKNYYRGFFRIHVEAGLGPEGQPPFTLTADYTLRDELSSVGSAYNYSEISAIYNVDPDRIAPVADANNTPKVDPSTGKPVYVNIPGHVKIGATWKHGQDVPLFTNINTYTAWVGVQF